MERVLNKQKKIGKNNIKYTDRKLTNVRERCKHVEDSVSGTKLCCRMEREECVYEQVQNWVIRMNKQVDRRREWKARENLKENLQFLHQSVLDKQMVELHRQRIGRLSHLQNCSWNNCSRNTSLPDFACFRWRDLFGTDLENDEKLVGKFIETTQR